MSGERVLVWDRTCTRDLPFRASPFGLSHTWWAGEHLFRALGRFDAAVAAADWNEALGFLAGRSELAHVEYWGHGHWGSVSLGPERLGAEALGPRSGHRRELEAIRERLRPDARWWFRTCDTFGSDLGHDFARRWTDFFGVAASGFTHVIGPLQSGLHTLRPGERPSWPALEGVREGTAAEPRRSTWSAPWCPHTVSCLAGRVPDGW